jgi:hypothetical protein
MAQQEVVVMLPRRGDRMAYMADIIHAGLLAGNRDLLMYGQSHRVMTSTRDRLLALVAQYPIPNMTFQQVADWFDACVAATHAPRPVDQTSVSTFKHSIGLGN